MMTHFTGVVRITDNDAVLKVQPSLLQEHSIAFFAEEVLDKQTVLNAPPLLRWFYQWIKNLTSTVLENKNIMLLTDEWAVLSV